MVYDRSPLIYLHFSILLTTPLRQKMALAAFSARLGLEMSNVFAPGLLGGLTNNSSIVRPFLDFDTLFAACRLSAVRNELIPGRSAGGHACSLCHDSCAENLVTLPCCRQIIGAVCLKNWLETFLSQRKCPHCRQVLLRRVPLTAQQVTTVIHAARSSVTPEHWEYVMDWCTRRANLSRAVVDVLLDRRARGLAPEFNERLSTDMGDQEVMELFFSIPPF